jgi:hypothetical protein
MAPLGAKKSAIAATCALALAVVSAFMVDLRGYTGNGYQIP